MIFDLDFISISTCLMCVALGFCLFYFLNLGCELSLIFCNFLKVKFGHAKWYCSVMERECHRYQDCPHYKFMTIYRKEFDELYESKISNDDVADECCGSD